VPSYAWAWLQRSRPVVTEAADRLTGSPPAPGFVDGLRERFENDPFTRDVVVAAVADVAFGGRLPRRRPPGASWDRGLTWWAAAINGTTPEQFEARSTVAAAQRRLFGDEAAAGAGSDAAPGAADGSAPSGATAPASPERALVVAGLRELLARGDGDTIPVAAVRSLLAALETAPAEARLPPAQ
jgi:hypothetical protein